jgi:hypothetical protein
MESLDGQRALPPPLASKGPLPYGLPQAAANAGRAAATLEAARGARRLREGVSAVVPGFVTGFAISHAIDAPPLPAAAPRLVWAITRQHVARAVLQAVRTDAEIVVCLPPGRLLPSAGSLAPEVADHAARWIGSARRSHATAPTRHGRLGRCPPQAAVNRTTCSCWADLQKATARTATAAQARRRPRGSWSRTASCRPTASPPP